MQNIERVPSKFQKCKHSTNLRQTHVRLRGSAATAKFNIADQRRQQFVAKQHFEIGGHILRIFFPDHKLLDASKIQVGGLQSQCVVRQFGANVQI